MYSEPIFPYRKPNYFDFGSIVSIFDSAASLTGTIVNSNATTKQIKAQTEAQLEAARLAAQANRPVVYSDPSGNKNNVILIIIAAVVVLIIIGLVIWAIVRKK